MGIPNAGKVTRPDKGSFPLDHKGVCKESMKEYMKCMASAENKHGQCMELSKKYLQCRIENGLMADENLDALGMNEKAINMAKTASANPVQGTEDEESLKQKSGWVSGVYIKRTDAGNSNSSSSSSNGNATN